MLVESGRGDRSVGESPASEVVRARLVQLIRDLQTTGPPARARYAVVEAPAEESVEENEPAENEPAKQASQPGEDWLDRLRSPGEPEPEVTAGTRPWLREAAGRAFEFGRAHLAAVVVVLLVGVAWSAYSLLQARSSPVAAAAPVIQTSPSPTPQPSGATTAQPVMVHVIGAVRKPGVVKLAEGSRVADAISAAGGLSESAAPGELNLAQVLADGVQVKIGNSKHPGGWIRDSADTGSAGSSGGSTAGDPAKVALNTATLEQLDTLPGVGPVTAQKILDWRKEHGRFTAITELQEVDGIGPKTYADLADHVRL